MSDNPYASPATEPPKFPIGSDPNKMQLASQGKRFLNYIIDYIAIQVLAMVAGFVIGALIAVGSMTADGTLDQESETPLGPLGIASFAVALIVSLGYFVLMEAVFQRTLGKLVTGTIVVTADGGSPSFGQILGRSLSRLIPFEAFSYLFGKPPVGWHDSLSGTRVIETR